MIALLSLALFVWLGLVRHALRGGARRASAPTVIVVEQLHVQGAGGAGRGVPALEEGEVEGAWRAVD